MSDMDPQAQRHLLGMLGAGAQYGVLLPLSRKHELEADQIGLPTWPAPDTILVNRGFLETDDDGKSGFQASGIDVDSSSRN